MTGMDVKNKKSESAISFLLLFKKNGNMKAGFFIISLVVLFFSCKSGQEMNKSREIRPMLKNAEAADYQPFYTVDSASINGNELIATIVFKGEKEIPEFDLVWNGMLMKSLPPKAAVVIVAKDGKQPQGKKMVKLTLKFQLSEFEKSSYTETEILLKGYPKALTFIK